jgi:hypothetical protein
MHDWTSRQTSDAQRDFSKPIPRRLGWAIPAAVAAGVLALTPAYLSIREVQREVDRINDALLMQQVDVQLGRTVPVSMEPLMELMKYDETEQIGAEQ